MFPYLLFYILHHIIRFVLNCSIQITLIISIVILLLLLHYSWSVFHQFSSLWFLHSYLTWFAWSTVCIFIERISIDFRGKGTFLQIIFDTFLFLFYQFIKFVILPSYISLHERRTISKNVSCCFVQFWMECALFIFFLLILHEQYLMMFLSF